MEESHSYNDQAKNLRRRMKGDTNSVLQEADKEQTTDVISNLPSRSEVHRTKQTKVKWKIKYPFIRLLVFLFVVLILLLPLYFL